MPPFCPLLGGNRNLDALCDQSAQAGFTPALLASPASPSLPPNITNTITRAKVLVRLPAWEEGVRVTLGYLLKVQGTLQRQLWQLLGALNISFYGHILSWSF